MILHIWQYVSMSLEWIVGTALRGATTFVVFALLCHCASGQDEAGLPSVGKIEGQLVDARNSIRSAIVEIESRVTHGDATQDIESTIYLDHERWRTDVRRRYRVKPEGVEDDHFVEITCFGCTPQEQRILIWSTEKVDADAGLALAFYDAEHVPERDRLPAVNIRVLGLAAAATLNTTRYTLDLLFGEESRSPGSATVDLDELQGEKLVRVSFERPNGAAVQYWCSPDHGYGIVRYEIARGDRTSSVDCELIELPAVANLWYPHVYKYERTVAGKLTHSEDATIRVTSLNEAIDDNLFSLKGIEELEAGTAVVTISPDERPRGQLEWTGSEIAPRGAPDVVMAVDYDRRRSHRVLLWGNLALLFTCLAVWLFRKLRNPANLNRNP